MKVRAPASFLLTRVAGAPASESGKSRLYKLMKFLDEMTLRIWGQKSKGFPSFFLFFSNPNGLEGRPVMNTDVGWSGWKKRSQGTSTNNNEENRFSQGPAFSYDGGDPAQTGRVGLAGCWRKSPEARYVHIEQFRGASFPEAGAGLGDVWQPPPSPPSSSPSIRYSPQKVALRAR